MMKHRTRLALACLSLVFSACTSTSPVKSQAYARLNDHRTFEYDFPTVWRGIERAMKNLKVVERDPEEVSELEMKKLTERTLETDWIYTESRDKYVEYEANGSPRKKYLMVRVRYEVSAQKSMAGTDVTVKTSEEIEQLKKDGTPAGYEKAGEPDTSRPNEILDRINGAILSGAP